MNEKAIRILNILPAVNYCGGIENYVMSYYRNVDKNKIQFDFITHTTLVPSFKPEILALGGRIYELPVFNVSNLKKIYQYVDALFLTTHYDIIHCHMANAAFLYFYLAKKHAIRNRILHSHQNKAADKIIHVVRNTPLLKIANYMATYRCACSEEAGQFLFGIYPFTIVKNAIDCEKFEFNQEIRNKMRKTYNLENKFVIGNIGRFVNQKNQMFLIEVFKEILQKRNNSVLLIVGDGELKIKLITKVKNYGLSDSVLFLDTQSNVNELYNIMDVFAFPSLYEGVGIVAIEAQCNGLPVLASNYVPKEAKVSHNIQFLPLDRSIWVKQLSLIKEEKRVSQINNLTKHHYNIKYEAKSLEDIYLGLM